MTASEDTLRTDRSLVDFIGIGIVHMGADYTIKLWNQWMVTHSGITAQQAVGRKLTDLFPDIRNNRMETAINGAIERQMSSVISPTFNTKHLPLFASDDDRQAERTMQVSISVTPLIWDKIAEGCLVQITNVAVAMRREQMLRDRVRDLRAAQTKLDEQAQDLRETNAELEQFAYVVSHDMRQPLRMIKSYLTLIERKISSILDAETQGFFAMAMNGAKNLDSMILDLLEYSRTGRNVHFSDVSLATACANALHHLGPVLDEVKPSIHIPDDLPHVNGHLISLTRLFQNLIDNAIKYRHPDRIPAIEVGWQAKEQRILIWVRDNGIGMQQDGFDRAFLVFQRLVLKSEYEGNGIGLAVCKKIVEQHGGKIWIQSQPDQGSTFFIDLPAYNQQ